MISPRVLMKIVSGMENLATPSMLETKVLQEQMASRHNRLACQAQVLQGKVVVRPG